MSPVKSSRACPCMHPRRGHGKKDISSTAIFASMFDNISARSRDHGKLSDRMWSELEKRKLSVQSENASRGIISCFLASLGWSISLLQSRKRALLPHRHRIRIALLAHHRLPARLPSIDHRSYQPLAIMVRKTAARGTCRLKPKRMVTSLFPSVI